MPGYKQTIDNDVVITGNLRVNGVFAESRPQTVTKLTLSGGNITLTPAQCVNAYICSLDGNAWNLSSGSTGTVTFPAKDDMIAYMRQLGIKQFSLRGSLSTGAGTSAAFVLPTGYVNESITAIASPGTTVQFEKYIYLANDGLHVY